MTLGTSPTFICKDREAVAFAVTIKLDSSSSQDAMFDVKTCRKGHCMAILDAKKFGVKEGKQGFVETRPGRIKVGRYFAFCTRQAPGAFEAGRPFGLEG